MTEAELFDGTVLEFPDGTAPDVIQRVVKQQTLARRGSSQAAPAPAQPAASPTTPDAPVQAWQGGIPVGGIGSVAPQPAGDSVVDTAMKAVTTRSLADHATGWVRSGAEGINRGIASVAGLPVDLINAAPMLANLIPGIDGVGPISSQPIGGSDWLKAITSQVAEALGTSPYEPQNPVERIAGRVGQEVGSTAAMLAGPLAVGAKVGVAGARALPTAARYVVEPAAVAPGALVRREGVLAVGAGTGAGVANEAVGNPQRGDNLGSDFAGSMVGALGTSTLGAGAGAVRNLASAARGTARFADDVAGEEVVDRIINSSTRMGAQAAETGSLDTSALAADLRRPAPVENAIPGYQANIADRSRDPGLATFAFNVDGARPGAAAARRTANEAAVARHDL